MQGIKLIIHSYVHIYVISILEEEKKSNKGRTRTPKKSVIVGKE